MSDDASENDAQQQTESEPETSQPSEPQPDEPASGEPNPNEPNWAQGKSREELLQQTEALMQTVGQPGQNQQAAQGQQQQQDLSQHPQAQRQQAQPQQQTQPRNAQGQYQSPQQQQAQGQQQMQGPPSPDLYYEEPEEYKRQMQRWQQQQVQRGAQQVAQQLQPMMQNQAESAKLQVKNSEEYADVFEEYEPEIVAEIQQVPANQRTIQAWQMAAEVVAGRHRKELAQKYAQQNQSQPSPTNRAGGGGSPTERSYRDEIDKLWESDHEYVRFCKNQGMTADDLRNRAQQMNLAPEEFVDLIKKDNIVASQAGLRATES